MSLRHLMSVGAVALCLATPVVAASNSGYGRGGKIKEFASEVDRHNSSGELFRIKGRCQSACTMFLVVRNSCVEPSARLLFHAGTDAAATSRMMNSYNSSLQGYLTARGAMKDRTFFAISGADIISKFGYRSCPK